MKPIKYKATHTGSRTKIHDGRPYKQVRWTIHINGQLFDYFEGQGHFIKPENKWARKTIGQMLINSVLSGEHFRMGGHSISHTEVNDIITKRVQVKSDMFKLLPPKLDDVLYCLVNDAEALDMCFEDWADNYGFDTDSKKAEKIYQSCVATGLKLRKTGINIQEQRERLADY